MWEISILGQADSLIFSVFLGIAISLCYDALRAQRRIFGTKTLLCFFGDVFFCFACAIVFFLHLLVFTNGEVRGFVFLAALGGFILCRLTLSRIFIVLMTGFFNLIFVILKKFGVVFKWVGIFFKKIGQLFKKISKNNLLKSKNS